MKQHYANWVAYQPWEYELQSWYFCFHSFWFKSQLFLFLYPHYEAKCVFFSLQNLLCTSIDVITDVYRFWSLFTKVLGWGSRGLNSSLQATEYGTVKGTVVVPTEISMTWVLFIFSRLEMKVFI